MTDSTARLSGDNDTCDINHTFLQESVGSSSCYWELIVNLFSSPLQAPLRYLKVIGNCFRNAVGGCGIETPQQMPPN